MFSKIVFLVIFSAGLAAANYTTAQPEVTTIQDDEYSQTNQIIRDFFTIEDPAVSQKAWDELVKKVVIILQTGKLNAIQRANQSEIEKVVKEWLDIETLKYSAMDEEKKIVDSLRTQALAKAPQEWKYALDITIQLFGSVKVAVESGDPAAAKWTIYQLLEYARYINVEIKKTISSRS